MKKKEISIFKGFRNGLLFVSLAVGMVACGGEGEVAEVDNELVTDKVATADTWDTNKFYTTFSSNKRYGEWDANDDNMLDRKEYNAGLYDTWDVNNNGTLDMNEWNTASKDWRMENETWTEWDASGDGILDENEWNTGFADNGWFGGWDANKDNMLGEREYSDGLFGLWDNDKNGMLDNNENGYYNTYYGD